MISYGSSRPTEIAGVLYLVPTEIGEPGCRGEPNIKWACVDTKEAAEIMRDVREEAITRVWHARIEETVAVPDKE